MGAEKSIFCLSFCPHFSARNSSTFEATVAINGGMRMGRRMNGVEMFMRTKFMSCPAFYWNNVVGSQARTQAGEFRSHAIEKKINDWRRIQSQHLAHEQSTHDGNAERFAQLGAHSIAQRQ